MTVAMAEKTICLPNKKTMMTKLTQSGLEIIIKSKVMKKMKQLTSINFFKCKVERKKISTRLVTKILT